MQEFIGHLEGTRVQTLQDHLDGTAELAYEFAKPLGLEKSAYILGKNHDLGKYGSLFQLYIRGQKKRGGDHSTAGARFLWDHKRQLGPLAVMGAFCIAGHHSGLMNCGTITNPEGETTLYSRMRKGVPDYEEFVSHGYMEEQILREDFSRFGKTPADGMMLIRMLFSCLVDADFLDTECFMTAGVKERGHFLSISDLADRFFAQLRNKGYMNPHNRINEKRYEILSACMKRGEGKPGLYTLTVPTGGGKTLASMAFAMKQAVIHSKRRIIYVIPYLSIIEQTASIFRDFLGKENILESHSNVNYDETENFLADRMKLAAENWDAPVIITTNEQFWESLYSNRTSKCRKLHNIANSVIIFDEAQMIPLDFLMPCLKALEELVKYYGCSAVLCSATQPELGKYLTLEPQEIMNHIPELYQFFNRVTYQFDGEKTYDEISENLGGYKQALCIASTKKEALEIFNRLDKKNGFYLSTNLCPAHRKKVIYEIKKRLKEGLPCRVVSTSIISVGVDVDFPVAYLEYNGLDGLIQGAGRCNREGKALSSDSIVHVFRTEKEKKSLFMRKEKQATGMTLAVCGEREMSSPISIKTYYTNWYKGSEGNMDQKRILPEAEDMAFRNIGEKFKLIQSCTKSVFVPLDHRAEEIMEQLMKGIRTRDLMREAGQYIVNVLYYAEGHSESPFSMMMNQGNIAWFEGDTELAYLANREAYDDRVGLKVEEKEGIGIMW